MNSKQLPSWLSVPFRTSLVIIALGAIAFLPFLGHAQLFDWDEINFAEISREMIALGDYLRIHVDFQPFYEKPPLFFWLQAASMQVFGVNAFAARLPNAICGIVTLLVVYHIGRSLHDRRFGLLWALAFGGSLLPNFYFHTGLIDPWFNLLIFSGLYFFIKGTSQESGCIRLPVLAGLLIGGAILTKGPVAYLVVLLCVAVMIFLEKRGFRPYLKPFMAMTLTAIATGLLWFGVETAINGPEFVVNFIQYQVGLLTRPVAGHQGFTGYHLVVTLFGCFPASILAIPALLKGRATVSEQTVFRLWMIVLLCVVLILFSLVQSKIVHYSSLVYFPVTYLAALTVHHAISENVALPRWLPPLLLTTGVIIGLILTAVPVVANNPEWITAAIEDPFAKAVLYAGEGWARWHSGIGILFLAMLIYGAWCFARNRPVRALAAICLTTAVVVGIGATFWMVKVLQYTQDAAVSFYQEKAEKECYITTLGFKSYAPYYYARVSPNGGAQVAGTDWLLHGEIDKPAYFVARIPKATAYEGIPGLEKLYELNGYVFFRRATATE